MTQGFAARPPTEPGLADSPCDRPAAGTFDGPGSGAAGCSSSVHDLLGYDVVGGDATAPVLFCRRRQAVTSPRRLV